MTDALPVPIESSTEVITVNELIEKISKNKKIDLNPIYQRDVVWNEQKMSAFIDSLMKGFVPSNITVNVDTDEKSWTCIDGKQRITSIMNFYRNKIPWVRTDDAGEDMFIYFNHVPEDKQDEKNYVHLDKKQQKFFLERSAIVVTYNDLEYTMQCDIFNRIQNSMAATSGEQCFSLFTNPTVASKFKEFCRKNDYAARTRFRHVEILLNIFYMKKNRELKALSGRKEKKKFIEELDELEEYERVVELIEEDLKVFFSEDMMAHKDMLGKKMTKNFVIALFYLLTQEKTKLKDLEKKQFPEIRKMLGKIWGKWNIVDGEINKERSKMSTKVLEKIEKLYDKNNGPIAHPGKKSAKNGTDEDSDADDATDDEDDEGSDAEDGSDVEDGSDDEDQEDEKVSKPTKTNKKVVKTKAEKKTPVKKVQSKPTKSTKPTKPVAKQSKPVKDATDDVSDEESENDEDKDENEDDVSDEESDNESDNEESSQKSKKSQGSVKVKVTGKADAKKGTATGRTIIKKK